MGILKQMTSLHIQHNVLYGTNLITVFSSMFSCSGQINWFLYSSTKSRLYCCGYKAMCLVKVKTVSPMQLTVTTRSPLNCKEIIKSLSHVNR